MPRIFASSNIYDKNGVLLLAKGQITTDLVMAKLRQHKYLETLNYIEDKQNEMRLVTLERRRMNVRNIRILEYANRILSNIIFESKAKQWWIYISALSNYVDWLYTHSIDVAVISLMVAIELKYNKEQLWNLGLGAILHDVGMMLIPKKLLQKTEPLNDREAELLSQHCELGESSLEAYHLPKEVMDVVIQHHELLDGSGYPHGLEKDEICRNAQIVRIADFIDQLTSGCPYMPNLKMNEAMSLLKDNEGKYSKELVAIFNKLLK